LNIYSIIKRTLSCLPTDHFFLLILPNHFRCRGLLLHLITLKDTHTHKHTQSVGLLWTRDRSVAETSTWQHTTFKKDKHPYPAGFEPEVPTSERPETHDLDGAATGIGLTVTSYSKLSFSLSTFNFLTCNWEWNQL